MRRVLAIVVLLAACGAGAFVLAGAGGGSSSGDYTVELDNAFGLVTGGDVKVAGVRAGTIQGFDIEPKTKKALVHISIDKQGFGDLRTDAFCSSRPQSLIGEYYLDCEPGTAKTKLKPGSTIPVSHTFSTIAPDLVMDTMRLPYRQRLTLILNSLGVTFAGNAKELNAAIRRAVPALRETDNLLAILGRQNQVISNLVTNGNKVITALANNKANVQRFIDEANKASTATAQRDKALAANFHKLPGFLAQLKPAMRDLGIAADANVPALRNLDASAHQLTRFFNDVTPFSKASTPAVRTLGAASKQGKQAVDAAPPVVKQLTQLAKPMPELGQNLAIVLQHLDNRKYAVEQDARSPTGQGYTGLEAVLRYIYAQSEATNIFDANSYKLKTSLFISSECSPYADAKTAMANNAKILKDCGSYYGPHLPGLTEPDPTAPGNSGAGQSASTRGAKRGAGGKGATTTSTTPAATTPQQAAPSGGSRTTTTPKAPPIDLGKTVQKLLGGLTGQGGTGSGAAPAPSGPAPGGSSSGDGARSAKPLLDFLLGP